LIGRLLCAAFVVATLCGNTAAANASPSLAKVTWHRDGLLTWERVERKPIGPPTLVRLSVSLAPGSARVIASGRPGLVEVRTLYSQRDGGPVRHIVLASRVVRTPKPRIVANGIGSGSLSSFEAHGIARMSYMARSAIVMLATAYTADSAGGSGFTAIGRRAGHGIVAVDPRVIPLGTHLFIPGYGAAVAGDTGGDIVGRRIDLGFDTLREAMLFGRRAITVYRLK
jgi:3D (Asp-Asp-Asp) domain-containing protein